MACLALMDRPTRHSSLWTRSGSHQPHPLLSSQWLQQVCPSSLLDRHPTPQLACRAKLVLQPIWHTSSTDYFPMSRLYRTPSSPPNMLASAGIPPRVHVDAVEVKSLTPGPSSVASASQLYTHWRADVDAQNEFVYMVNRGPAATFTLAFDTAQKEGGTVRLGCLDRTHSRRCLCTRGRKKDKEDGRLVVNVTLSHEQSTILAFVVDNKAMPVNIVAHSPNVASIGRGRDGRLHVLVEEDNAASLSRSNESTVAISPSINANRSSTLPGSHTLGPWNLSVESYAAPDVLKTNSVAANKTTVAVPTPLTKLVPWTQIPSLERVSGVGTYTTTFALDTTTTDDYRRRRLCLHPPPHRTHPSHSPCVCQRRGRPGF